MTISANFPNVKPSLLLDFANAQQLPPAVTFTRATTAAYYNGSTTAMAEQNLVTYSQEFDNAAWLLTNNSIVTANTTTAPDGTLTADTFSATGSSTTTGTPTQVYKFVDATNLLTYTATIYAKANTSNFVYFREYFSHNTEDVTWFNLSTGALGTTSANHTASIVSVGSGWYRCVITTTADATRNQSLGFGVSTANSNYDITTSSSIYLWGAQFEQRNAVTAYTATTTAAITNYIPQLLTAGGGQPRFDHNPTTSESLGLLIEEQRTNTVLASEQFGNATYWGLGGGSVTSNSIVAPNGTLTGDTLVSAASGLGASGVYQIVTGLSSGSTYTFSCYVKANGSNWVQLIATLTGGSAAPTRGWFNLSTGVVGSTNNTSSSLTIASVGNGWYRCTMIVPALTTTGTTVYTTCSNGDGIDAFTNNGWNGLFLWGAQLELGSFATSYIPTTTAAATRAADDASMTGTNFSSWFQQQQGSLYFETSYLKSGVRSPFQIGSSSSNRYGFYTNDATLSYYDGSVPFTTSFPNTSNKVACSLVNYDIAVAINNGSATSATGRALLNVDKFTIGSAYYGGEYICGTIKKMAYYPARLTNAQLQALTS